MQNPAIKTLKAIREIQNEPHQQQVHMGGCALQDDTNSTATWQFGTLLPISIAATTILE